MALWPDAPQSDPVRMQDYEVHEESRIAQVTAVVRSTLAVEEIGPWLKNSYGGDIDRVLSERQAGPTGGPPSLAIACSGGVADSRSRQGFPRRRRSIRSASRAI